MLELRILNGLHQGASLSLDGEDIMLGSSLEADIELLDQGVVNRHCTIEYSKTRNQWVLKALEGSLFTASGQRPIKSTAIQKGLVVKLGAIYLGFFDSADAWDLATYNQLTGSVAKEKNTSSLPLKKYRFHIGIVTLIGSLVTYSIADDGKGTKSGDYQDATIIETTLPQASSTGMDKVLENMLRQRGLLHNVKVSQTDDAWTLSGQLSDDELATVARMMIRFKDQYPNIELKNATVPVNRVLPFKIKSVSSGLYAHVMTTDGDRIYVGDSFKGFTLKKIDIDKIVFTGDTDVELLW